MPRSPVFPILLLTLAVLAAAPAWAADVLEPVGEAVVLPVGKSARGMKDYVLIGAEPVRFEVKGAGRLYGFARLRYDEGDFEDHAGSLIFTGLKEPRTESFVFTPDPDYRFGVDVPGRAGGANKVEFRVGKGKHRFAVASGAGEVLLRLYWDPDPTPESPWKFGASVGLETIYDDNFLRYSDDYLVDFHAGTYPYKFQIDRKDSHILAPSVDVYAQRRLISWGDTRFRFKFKRWQYVQGDIKSNMGFDYYVRQYLPQGRSLEFWYNYAPQQYIRELSYRTPLQPSSDPLEWGEFRYSRNVFNLIFRTKVRKNMSLKLHLSRALRYYNQEFMENDIKDLGLRTTLYWTVHRDWRLTLDYGYTDAPARGANEVGETLEGSDDSDPSYERDLYQVDVRWSPGWMAPVCDSVSLRGQHQIYWFTSTKALADDPYHVGRKDKVYALQFEGSRRLTKSLSMDVGFRYTERVVESPWRGDIAEDKDYTQRRYWIGLTYKL